MKMLRTMFVTLCLLQAYPAMALTVEAGLLTKVSEGVQVTSGGEARAAVPFMKLAEGDVLVLPEGASAEVVYFENGRHETWQGGGAVKIAVGGGSSEGLQPGIRRLPPLMVAQLEKTPVGGKRGKAGMVVLRALPDIDAIIEVEEKYKQFRAEAPAGDTTPELYFLNGMLDLKQYDRVRDFLEELRAREAAEPALAGIIAHYGPLVALPASQ